MRERMRMGNGGERMCVCKIKKRKKKRTDENAAFLPSL